MQRDAKKIKPNDTEPTPIGKFMLQSADYFSLFARHLPRNDRASLRQTCKRANALGAIYEFNLHHSPKLLLEQMRSMDKKNISLLLRDNFALDSENYALMIAKATELPKDPYAIAFFAFIAPVTEINHQELKLAYDFLLAHRFEEQSCVMQSIAFQLEWHDIKLRKAEEDFLNTSEWQRKLKLTGAMLLHPQAYYNLRGADLSNIRLNCENTALDYENGILKYMLGFDNHALRNNVPDFSWASFTGAILRKTFFQGVNLVGADFHGTQLQKVTFNNSNLAFCDMDAAIFAGTMPGHRRGRWLDCDFTGAKLSHIYLGERYSNDVVTVQGCTFTGASFAHSVIDALHPPLQNSNFSDVDFTAATFIFGRFAHINLQRAIFKGANVAQADFRRAELDGTDFSVANLSEANFEGVNLQSVLNLDQAYLTKARYDSYTRFPSFLFFPSWNGMVNQSEKQEKDVPVVSKQNCVVM